VEATISIESGERERDLGELLDWLEHDHPSLRHLVSEKKSEVGDTELSGGTVEALAVALGVGGAGMVLAGGVADWLRARQTPMIVRIARGSTVKEIQIPHATREQIDRALDLLRDDPVPLSEPHASPDAVTSDPDE
jgi:hypothetical protein